MLFFLCSLSLSLECQLLRHPGSTLHTTAGCSCVLHSHSGTCSVLGRSHGNPLATSQNQEGVFYGSYFPEAETDAQKGRLTCSRSSCKEVTELRFASSSLCRPRLPAQLLPGSSWTQTLAGLKRKETWGNQRCLDLCIHPSGLVGSSKGGQQCHFLGGLCWGTVGAIGDRQCRGRGRGNLFPSHITAMVPWPSTTRPGIQNDSHPQGGCAATTQRADFFFR